VAEPNLYFNIPDLNPNKPLADVLNCKFNSSFAAFKALDIFNKSYISEPDFQVGLRNLGL